MNWKALLVYFLVLYLLVSAIYIYHFVLKRAGPLENLMAKATPQQLSTNQWLLSVL